MFSSQTRSVNDASAVLPSQPSQDIENRPSSALINALSTATQPTRKRKHAEISKQVHVHQPFAIQAHPSSPSEDSLRLVPQLLIPRSCLPLAYLDPGGAARDLRGNRLFYARIPALEEDLPSEKNSIQPTILIAVSQASAHLYAVERVRSGTYALCRLGAWVTLKELERLKLECSSQTKATSTQRASSPGNEWWRASAIKADCNQVRGQSQKQKQVSLESFRLCLNSPLSATIAASPVVDEIPVKESQDEETIEVNDASNEPQRELLLQEPDETLKMIRTQYQEALYMSQGSLAYFAKGPLSRARALFNSSDVLSTDGLSLPDYLRTCILSLPTMDKKYRETLPSMVKELPVGVFSEDENDSIFTSFRKKPRKTKTSKPGKDGLYPEEEVSVVRWWLSRSNCVDNEDSFANREESVRIRLLEQKARETQLQIILVLETLALEASKLEKKSEDVPAVIREENCPSKQKPKTKKLQDLNVLLNLLVDRLCIWQSMSTEEGSSSTNANKFDFQKTGMTPNQVPNVDILRNFCVDVVLPFYSARLPDTSTALCQKLGGPKPPSPARPPLRKATTSSQVISHPGAAVHRPQMRRPRRTLERVLTEERSASRNPPSLSRSATDSVLPRLKREVSEASMSSIPISNVKSRRYSQREVDLGSMSQTKEAKLKQKARIEQELKGAIAALKKPNPRMAVKELVDAAERRAGVSDLQKPRSVLRNRFAQGVQVMATPRVNKKRDAFVGLPSLPNSYQEAPLEIEEVPQSSAPHQISSTPKTRGNRQGACSLNVLPTIEQTPCRGPSKLLLSDPNVLWGLKRQDESAPPAMAVLKAEYPVKLTTTSISDPINLGTPSHPVPQFQGQGASGQRIQDTPVKGLKATPVAALRSSTLSLVGNENDECIYERLGWDDDADELM